MTKPKVPSLPESLAVLALSPAAVAWRAYVVQHLWAWFIAPIALRPLTFWETMGALLLLGTIKGIKPPRKADIDAAAYTNESTIGMFVQMQLAAPAFALAIGQFYLWAAK